MISLGLALGLAGCSASQEPPTPAPDPAAVEKAEQEEERVDGVRAEINRLADGYDYDAAIKLAKKDSAEQLNQMASGLEEEKGQVSAWEEPNNIPHLFFHSLIVDPGRAFDEGSSSQGYADYMVTQKEFAAILDELYARDYVLVNPEDFASLDGQGQMEYRDIMLPQGKKPVVLSIDDLSYYEYMEGDGFASKLVLDKDGKVRNEYVDAEGKTQVGAFDVTTMVDDFVAEHPDFTYRDARGLIAMTGYNGAFGYRTSASQYPQSKTLEADQKKAAEIAEAMKNSGWVFASHSWGHIATGTVSMDRLKRDTKLWKAEVEPIVGKTGHYIYPFGSDIARTQRYAGDRYQFFKDQGFGYFYGVDGTTRTWMQQGDEYQRQMRINVDGLQFAKELRGDRPVLGSFFKVEDVIDPARE
ncbi:polysaccharide deacetylase [Arthrobacter sp. MYb214]|uniref:polysaccharide deacetylase family protein n=1 Tax=Arthrobacter sp. MYb214 TaxID=1848596 RepID=UPI0025711542|nr:polysaccharide deacetylase [Arthrobacter sp. MYb214]